MATYNDDAALSSGFECNLRDDRLWTEWELALWLPQPDGLGKEILDGVCRCVEVLRKEKPLLKWDHPKVPDQHHARSE